MVTIENADGQNLAITLGKELINYVPKYKNLSIFVINNLQPKIIQFNLSEINLIATESWYDIITETQIDIHNNKLYLDPYQTVWITNK